MAGSGNDESAVHGIAEDVKGKAKEVAGEVVGDEELQEEGRAQQDKGRAEMEAADARAEADRKAREAERAEEREDRAD